MLTFLHVDWREGPVTALGADSLDASLVFIEVDVRDLFVELNTSRNIVASVVTVLVVNEGTH